MKKILILPVTGLLLFTGCKKDIMSSLPVEENLHVSSTASALNVSSPETINFSCENLFPEGLVYDEARNRFYVSSATGPVGIVTADGNYTSFITDAILTGTTGLKIDRARNRLWVSNTWSGGVGVYDLNSGLRIFYADFASLTSGGIFINDIALDPQGNAYVTNSFEPEIFKVDVNGNVSVFFYDPSLALAPGEFGMTGIQYDKHGFLLVGYANQVLKIPVRNASAYTVVLLDTPVYPDGLLLSKDGKQLLVVNNTGGTQYDSIVSFITNDHWSSGSVSTYYNTGAVFPTSATSDGKKVFVLYSHIHKLLAGESETIFTIKQVPLMSPTVF